MRTGIIFTSCLLAIAIFMLPADSIPAQTKPAAEAGQPQAAAISPGKDFMIGVEDVLSVNVWREPELSLKEVVVRPDGKISLPLVSDILASGLTTVQLQEKIAEKLKEFISSPVVSVTVVRIASLSVSIVGEVLKPGSYPLVAPMTVLELLARAGGVTQDAKSKKIKILRKEDGKTIQINFNYKEVRDGKNLPSNILLKNGDVVVVP
jgi:polysaccharide export outer membrane protein